MLKSLISPYQAKGLLTYTQINNILPSTMMNRRNQFEPANNTNNAIY
ncbi:RNA polymerase sigma factor region1.1 domain-containing protein [Pseudoalteromonas arctica]